MGHRERCPFASRLRQGPAPAGKARGRLHGQPGLLRQFREGGLDAAGVCRQARPVRARHRPAEKEVGRVVARVLCRSPRHGDRQRTLCQQARQPVQPLVASAARAGCRLRGGGADPREPRHALRARSSPQPARRHQPAARTGHEPADQCLQQVAGGRGLPGGRATAGRRRRRRAGRAALAGAVSAAGARAPRRRREQMAG